MRWKTRMAVGFTGAVSLLLLGMVTAQATCTSTSTSPPDSSLSASLCAMEGWDHSGDDYDGRYSVPVDASIDDTTPQSSSWTRAYASQDHWTYGPSEFSWRDTMLGIDRTTSLSTDDWMNQHAWVRQTRWSTPDQDDQWTSANVATSSYGPGRVVQADVWVQQYRSDGCRESGSAYVRANGTSSYTPVEEHACPVEAPEAPDMP